MHPAMQASLTSAVVIIPARGGSKGIPNKNIRPLWGKTLVAYSIESALADGFDKSQIILSSDASSILAVGQTYGIVSAKRPDLLASDTASTESVLLYHLEQLAGAGQLPAYTILLQPTSPIRQPGRVSQALRLCIEQAWDSLVSVVPFHGFVWQRQATGELSADYQPQHRPRRQELSGKKFLENGSIYVSRSRELIKHKSRLFGRIGMLEMTHEESLEIDSELDWQNIETRDELKQVAGIL